MASIRTLALIAALAVGPLSAGPNRVVTQVNPAETVALKGHVHPLALPQYDQGPADPAQRLTGMTLLFKPDSSIESFLNDQQDRSSASYHRWLTPEQFADRFGLSEGDIAKISRWLRSEGLQVDARARGRNWITFSGTAAQAGHAFHTAIHNYRVGGRMHYANSTEPSVPAAIAGVVAGFEGLSDFRLQPLVVNRANLPEYNLGSGHVLAPDDLAAIYDISPLYSAGIDGAGQAIAVVGTTAIDLSDLKTFRSKFHLPANDPQVVLVGDDPGNVGGGPLLEADLDLEWAGAIARNASLIYVYSFDVQAAAQYAIDQNLAPVLTMSYGGCEPYNSLGFRSVAQQANAQGITFLASSGDGGPATCDYQGATPQASLGVTINSPADFPEVTAVGGTEFNEGTGAYWSATNSATDASALSFIPEAAWDDSLAANLVLAGGGGPSAVFPKPIWQTGPGVPADSARDIPDVALAAAVYHDPYFVVSNGDGYLVGGTSAASPVFAGMVALLNQYLASATSPAASGLGNINPPLYRLAQSTTDVFHDVTAGNNMVPCVQSSPDCVNGLLGFPAGPGYDLATGLGSVDADHLVMEWNTRESTHTALTASPAKYGLADTVQLSATVSATGGAAGTPTGNVTFLTADTALGSAALSASTGSANAGLQVSGSLLAGSNGTVSAVYDGDSTFNGSGASAPVTLNLPSSGSLAVPFVTPNPVYPQSPGPIWVYTVTLTEQAGVPTSLQFFTIDNGVNRLDLLNGGVTPSSGAIPLPAHGRISGGIYTYGFTPPQNQVFRFSGTDAGGAAWTRQISVPFLAPESPILNPEIVLSSSDLSPQRNPQADPSCQWSQPLTLQEESGYLTVLDSFTAGGADLSTQIQQVFGTTRLAPFGMLSGNVCWSGSGTGPGAKQYRISGTNSIGATASASLVTTLLGPAVSPATSALSAQAVTLSVPDTTHDAAQTVGLSFTAGSPQWTAYLAPANAAGAWLTVSPSSGAGAATLNLQASVAGLSKGVYRALLSIAAQDAIPQVITVPVTFVVGASADSKIYGIANNFSGSTAIAPGEQVGVYGTQLAPSLEIANFMSGSLPLTLAGVSATVNGIAAPLYYVSPGQLDIQIPYEAGSGPSVLAVNNNGQIASFSFPMVVSAPGMFPAVLTPAFTVAASAQPGDVLIAFITGEGDTTPFIPTGATPAPDTPIANLPQPLLPVTLTVGGVPATVLFVGIIPGVAGEMQLNFQVPTVPAGALPVVVTVGGNSSPPVSLTVTAPAAP